MTDHRIDRLGQQLGPYRLTRLLGAGGFGEVYEAEHLLLQQKRAIKLLLERYFHDPNHCERFLREARTLATLEHPNIVPVLEVGEEGNVLYLVVPYYRRGTLNDFLKQRTTPLPLAQIEPLLAQMCAAVGYAHARNIAHLDLKPENMLIHEDGRLVLSDFGLAHLIKQGRLEAGSSASWGTPYYMAPEQIRGEPELRSDLYALGIILYQLLTNQRPFTGNAPEAVMMKHLLEPPPPLHTIYSAAPAALEPVIQKALEKKPEDRYATAEALLVSFRAVVSNPSLRSAQSSTPIVFPAVPTGPMNGPAPAAQPTILMSPGHGSHTAAPINTTKATAAVCEIEVGGQGCGVQAVGRCASCKRGFCATHQAWSGQTYYIDQCAPCLAKAQTEKVKREREIEAKRQADEAEAREYIQSGSARIALLTGDVQPVNIYRTRKKEKKGFFGQKHQWIEEIASVRRGWILGAVLGEYSIQGEGSWTKSSRTRLIALLDLDHHQVVLTPVEPYSESYKEVDTAYLSNWGIAGVGWIEAARAVRRLIELRHLGIQSIFARRVPTQQGENSYERMQTLAGKSGFIRIEGGKEPGRIFEIHKELSIGQNKERDIFLEDFDVDGLQATVINLGNGNYVLRVDSDAIFSSTKINGQLLPPNERTYKTNPHTYPLQSGDHIHFDQQSEWSVFRIRSGQQMSQTVLVFEMK